MLSESPARLSMRPLLRPEGLRPLLGLEGLRPLLRPEGPRPQIRPEGPRPLSSVHSNDFLGQRPSFGRPTGGMHRLNGSDYEEKIC